VDQIISDVLAHDEVLYTLNKFREKIEDKILVVGPLGAGRDMDDTPQFSQMARAYAWDGGALRTGINVNRNAPPAEFTR
jgi:hypothetical protein